MNFLTAPAPLWLSAAGYAMTALLCLVVLPIAFISFDHGAVASWSSLILDFVGG